MIQVARNNKKAAGFHAPVAFFMRIKLPLMRKLLPSFSLAVSLILAAILVLVAILVLLVVPVSVPIIPQSAVMAIGLLFQCLELP
jgi:hypothetical protein